VRSTVIQEIAGVQVLIYQR